MTLTILQLVFAGWLILIVGFALGYVARRMIVDRRLEHELAALETGDDVAPWALRTSPTFDAPWTTAEKPDENEYAPPR